MALGAPTAQVRGLGSVGLDHIFGAGYRSRRRRVPMLGQIEVALGHKRFTVFVVASAAARDISHSDERNSERHLGPSTASQVVLKGRVGCTEGNSTVATFGALRSGFVV
jgi:hypothetical protein